MFKDTLYKRTTTGAIQTWKVEVEGDSYRTHSGQLNSKIVISKWTVCSGKNLGKANETTAEEQALLEVDALYRKKMAQGQYETSIDDIDDTKYFKPMLAKTFESSSFDLSEGWHSQPKLDGIRCIATKDGLFSRQGKPITSCKHISSDLSLFFSKYPEAILDGELYTDKLSDNFSKILSLVRKQKPSSEDEAESAKTIEYHVYDFPTHKVGFDQRYNELEKVLDLLGPSIQLVETTKIVDRETLEELFSNYISAGYEGQILRKSAARYEQKRSGALLKRKEFDDNEFELVSINEGIGNRSGMAGFITYKLGDGREFNSSIRGSHEYCKELLKNKDIYTVGTVRYFGLTPDGIPRFPVTVALYDKERDT